MVEHDVRDAKRRVNLAKGSQPRKKAPAEEHSAASSEDDASEEEEGK